MLLMLSVDVGMLSVYVVMLSLIVNILAPLKHFVAILMIFKFASKNFGCLAFDMRASFHY
jgi:hypothetical protein